MSTEPKIGLMVCSEDETNCPQCHSDDIDRMHVGPDSSCGECYYWACAVCEHQWGHA